MIFKIPFVQTVIDFLLPPQCALCHEIVQKSYTLCSACWSQLKFITSPKCSICCVPLENVDHDMPCIDCLKNPPTFAKAHAPLVYNGAIKKLILQYKNHDALHLGPLFLQWIQQYIPKDTHIIIPVPLHWWRFFIRQYNQSTELCKLIRKHVDLPIYTKALKRNRSTTSQRKKSKILRYQNMQDAFAVNDPKNILKGANVLLVDDVLSSGATANACAKALLESGAKKIEVLTIARASKGYNGTI